MPTDGDLPDNLPSHLSVLDRLGRGGTGVVWRARDRRRGRDVAVKVLVLSDDDRAAAVARSRVEREARALARLGGRDDVAPLRAVGVDDRGRAWIVSDLVEGPTLADRVAGGPLAADGSTALFDRLAGALAAVHGAGVVHGDVTPANVVLRPGSGAVLVDFGLAGLGDVVAGPGDRALTRAFAAPERLLGAPVSAATDVYGLGATVWAAAVGAPPPGAGEPVPAEVPASLARRLARCTDPDPARRPVAAALVAGRG